MALDHVKQLHQTLHQSHLLLDSIEHSIEKLEERSKRLAVCESHCHEGITPDGSLVLIVRNLNNREMSDTDFREFLRTMLR